MFRIEQRTKPLETRFSQKLKRFKKKRMLKRQPKIRFINLRKKQQKKLLKQKKKLKSKPTQKLPKLILLTLLTKQRTL